MQRDRILKAFFIAFGEVFPELTAHFGNPFNTPVKLTRSFQEFGNSAQQKPALYVSWNGSAPRGVPAQPEIYNPVTGIFDTPVIQYLETSFQFMASERLPAEDMNAPEAGDIASLSRTMLLSTQAKQLFKKKGYQVLRASELRSQKIQNEEKQFEDFPNFDIVFSHAQTIIGSAQPAQTITGEFFRANGA